jgi:hypothetical protein
MESWKNLPGSEKKDAVAGTHMSKEDPLSEIIEIELRYYDQTDVNTGHRRIVDLVLLLEKVLPAWEFRSNFVKSVTNGSGMRRHIDLYYTAKVPVGTYVCRFESINSLSTEKSRELRYSITTKEGISSIHEIPDDVKMAFENEIDVLV